MSSKTARPSKIVPRCTGDTGGTGKRQATVYRSAGWMKAVAELETCVLCGRHGVQVAHRNEDKGRGMKVDDCLTAALCPACHDAIDNGKDMTRDERRAAMDRAIVLTLRALVRTGKVGII